MVFFRFIEFPDMPPDSSKDLPVVVAALYRFVHLPDYRELRGALFEKCRSNHIKGTLLLAEEGINGTIAGTRSNINALLDYLRLDPRFSGLECKESRVDSIPFYRMKVKIKKEIVTMGIPAVDANRRAGIRVNSVQWNKLIKDPAVLVLDARNQYEYDIGTFKNAVSSRIQNFREFPAFVKDCLDPDQHKKIAMFCTGGIRCEKATSYLLDQGFTEVYHLSGGILKYLEDMKPEESLWQGECFVFDGRVAVDHNLERGSHEMCYSCRMPLTPKDRMSPAYEEGVSCQHCHTGLTEEKRDRLRERMRQVHLARERNQQHIGLSLVREK